MEMIDCRVSESNGRLLEAAYLAPKLWHAKRVYRVVEPEAEPKCDPDCEGCGQCLQFSEIGLKIWHRYDREFFVSLRLGTVSTRFQDTKDESTLSLNALRHSYPQCAAVVERICKDFEYSLVERSTRERVHITPETTAKPARRAITRRQCFSEAHAVAQYKIAVNRGLKPQLSCSKFGYVVSWEG